MHLKPSHHCEEYIYIFFKVGFAKENIRHLQWYHPWLLTYTMRDSFLKGTSRQEAGDWQQNVMEIPEMSDGSNKAKKERWRKGWRSSQAQQPQINGVFDSWKSRGGSRTATPDFQRAYFGLFRRLFGGVPWEAVLEGKGVQEGRNSRKKTQQQAVPMCQKMSQHGRRPSWLNTELWLELRRKRRFMTFGRRGKPFGRSTKLSWGCAKVKIRMAKAQLKLSLATAVKVNKQGFYKHKQEKED